METISTHEAKTHLSRYLAEVEQGKEFIIARGKSPVARLVPMIPEARPPRPKVGQIRGPQIDIPASALAPLDEAELKQWGL
jgi:prevent-host-death family protein